MAVEVKVPELGENVEVGTVVGILVTEGDTIEVDQPVIELETDKAVLEVPASVSGTVEKLFIQDGDEIGPGQVILTVADSNGPAAADAAPSPTTAAAPDSRVGESEVAVAEAPSEASAPTSLETESATQTVIEFKLPELGEDVEIGTVVGILVSVGDRIEDGQPLLELETDKAVLEVPADVSGVVQEILVQDGDQAGPGQAVMMIQTSGGAPVAAKADAPKTAAEMTIIATPEPVSQPAPEAVTPAPMSEPPSTPTSANGAGVAPGMDLKHLGERLHEIAPAAPSVRRFAREIGIDIHYVPGNGPGGRISEEDVKTYSRQVHAKMAEIAAKPATASIGMAQQPLPDFSKWGEFEKQPLRGIRRATAKNMAYAWATIPHVTQHDKADITELEKFRKQYARRVEAAGAKLTPTAIIIKVLAAALKVFPQFNASIDMENEEIILKKYCHIGVAVDTPNGLLVPVIRDADQKNLIDISVELGDLAKRARERKVSLDEMQGASITLTNLGGIGGTNFTPIVNPPEVAILGVSRGQTEPVWHDGEFQPRMILPLSLSYDHRAVDGADGARFARWIAEALEQPFVVMLEG